MLKQQTILPVRLYARLSKDDGDADKESNSITNQLQTVMDVLEDWLCSRSA